MKPKTMFISGGIVVGAMLTAHAANATDTKVDTAATCQPYSTTTLPSDLSFRAHGLKNISADAEYVVCNVLVDAESPTYWTKTDPAQVKVVFHAAATNTARCELYIGSNLAGSPVSYVQDLSLSAGEPGHILFGDVSGSAGQWPSVIGDRPPVSLFCRMPPGASILKIETSETGATDA